MDKLNKLKPNNLTHMQSKSSTNDSTQILANLNIQQQLANLIATSRPKLQLSIQKCNLVMAKLKFASTQGQA
jgi:hypothetical protein